MELQSRKLDLIDYLSRTQDESLLNKIEELIKKSRKPAKLKPFSTKEYLRLIEKSEEDVSKGRVYAQEEVARYFKAKK